MLCLLLGYFLSQASRLVLGIVLRIMWEKLDVVDFRLLCNAPRDALMKLAIHWNHRVPSIFVDYSRHTLGILLVGAHMQAVIGMNKRVLQARAQALSPHRQDQHYAVELRTGAISSPRSEEGLQDVATIDLNGTISVWQAKAEQGAQSGEYEQRQLVRQVSKTTFPKEYVAQIIGLVWLNDGKSLLLFSRSNIQRVDLSTGVCTKIATSIGDEQFESCCVINDEIVWLSNFGIVHRDRLKTSFGVSFYHERPFQRKWQVRAVQYTANLIEEHLLVIGEDFSITRWLLRNTARLVASYQTYPKFYYLGWARLINSSWIDSMSRKRRRMEPRGTAEMREYLSPTDQYLVLSDRASSLLRIVHLYEPKRTHDVIDLNLFLKKGEQNTTTLENVIVWVDRDSFVVLLSNGESNISKRFKVAEQVTEVDLDTSLLGFHGSISSVVSLGWGYLMDMSKGILWKLSMIKKSSALKWKFETERVSRRSIERNLLPLMTEDPRYIVKMALLKTATKSQTQRYFLFKGLEAAEIALKGSSEIDDRAPLLFDNEDQIDILLCRIYLLATIERLETYLSAVSGAWSSTAFSKFRRVDIRKEATCLARNGDIFFLGLLFAHHAHIVAKSWLDILSNLPPTFPVSQYSHLLPEKQSNGRVVIGMKVASTVYDNCYSDDWIYSLHLDTLRTIWSKIPNSYDTLIPNKLAELIFQNPCGEWIELDARLSVSWYISRSKAIDIESGHLENATKLLDCAIDNGLREDITSIQDEAAYFSEFAYDLNTNCKVALADFLELDSLGKLEVLVDFSSISRFFYTLDTYGIPFASMRAPTNDSGVQWLKHAIQKSCVNNALLVLAIILAAAKELHNCAEFEENAQSFIITAEDGGDEGIELPALKNPCYPILARAMGDKIENVAEIVLCCLKNCVDTRLSALGWSKLASAIASLRESLTTMKNNFDSSEDASQTVKSLEYFQGNSETASILAYYGMHVSMTLEGIDGGIALQRLISSLTQNEQNSDQISQILDHYTLISSKFEVSERSRSRCDHMMGLQLLGKGCYEEFSQWMIDEDEKVACVLESAKEHLLSGEVDKAQKSLETVSQQSDIALRAHSLIDSLKSAPLSWSSVTENLLTAIRGMTRLFQSLVNDSKYFFQVFTKAESNGPKLLEILDDQNVVFEFTENSISAMMSLGVARPCADLYVAELAARRFKTSLAVDICKELVRQRYLPAAELAGKLTAICLNEDSTIHDIQTLADMLEFAISHCAVEKLEGLLLLWDRFEANTISNAYGTLGDRTCAQLSYHRILEKIYEASNETEICIFIQDTLEHVLGSKLCQTPGSALAFVSELFCTAGRIYFFNGHDDATKERAPYDQRHNLFVENQKLSIEAISSRIKEKAKDSKLWILMNKMLTIIDALKAGTESFGGSVAPTLIKFLLSQGDAVDSNNIDENVSQAEKEQLKENLREMVRDLANDSKLTSDEVYNTISSISEIAATFGAFFNEELTQIYLDNAFQKSNAQSFGERASWRGMIRQIQDLPKTIEWLYVEEVPKFEKLGPAGCWPLRDTLAAIEYCNTRNEQEDTSDINSVVAVLHEIREFLISCSLNAEIKWKAILLPRESFKTEQTDALEEFFRNYSWPLEKNKTLSDVVTILTSAQTIDTTIVIFSLCRSRLHTLGDGNPCLVKIADSMCGLHEEIWKITDTDEGTVVLSQYLDIVRKSRIDNMTVAEVQRAFRLVKETLLLWPGVDAETSHQRFAQMEEALEYNKGLLWVTEDDDNELSSDFACLYPAVMNGMQSLTVIISDWCKGLAKIEKAWVAASALLEHEAEAFLQIFMKPVLNNIVEDLDRGRLQALLDSFSTLSLPDTVVNDLRLGLWRLATSTFSDAKSSEVTSMLENMQDTVRNWSNSTQIESFGAELRQNGANLFLRKLREGLTSGQIKLMEDVDTSELASNFLVFVEYIELLKQSCPVERDQKSHSFAGILRAISIWYTAGIQPRSAKSYKENESLCLRVLPLFLNEFRAENREAYMELLYFEIHDGLSVLSGFKKALHNFQGHPMPKLEVCLLLGWKESVQDVANQIVSNKHRIIETVESKASYLTIVQDAKSESETTCIDGNRQEGTSLGTFEVTNYVWALLVAAGEDFWKSVGEEQSPILQPPPWDTLIRDNSWFCDMAIAQAISWIQKIPSSTQGFEWACSYSDAGVVLRSLSCIGLLSNLALFDSSMAGAVVLRALHTHPILWTVEGAKRVLTTFLRNIPTLNEVTDSLRNGGENDRAKALENSLVEKCATCLNLLLSSRWRSKLFPDNQNESGVNSM